MGDSQSIAEKMGNRKDKTTSASFVSEVGVEGIVKPEVLEEVYPENIQDPDDLPRDPEVECRPASWDVK